MANEQNVAGRNNRSRTVTTVTTTVAHSTTAAAAGNMTRTTSRRGRTPQAMTSSIQTTTQPPVTTTSSLCKGISGDHSAFIKHNLQWLTEKCREFQTCTDELYKSENSLLILAGDNIQLRNICRFLNQNINGVDQSAHSQCSSAGRDSIKQLLGTEVTSRVRDSSGVDNDADRTSWRTLQDCLDNVSDVETDMEEICRLKGNTTRPLCNSTNVERTTETFFNQQLKQLHCSCDTITAESTQAKGIPLGALVGGVCGLSLVSLLVVIIVVLCVRHHRLQRRLKWESKRIEDKTSDKAPDDFDPFYYEANDPCKERDIGRKRTRRGQRPTQRPPPLPSRNLPPGHLTDTSSNQYEYLELLPDVIHPRPRQALRASQGPGTSRDQGTSLTRDPYEMAKQIPASPASARKINAGSSSQEEKTYFDKIDWNSVTKTTEEGGYSVLGGKVISQIEGRAEASEELQVVRSQLLAPEKDEEGSSQKDPPYFELEEVSTTAM